MFNLPEQWIIVTFKLNLLILMVEKNMNKQMEKSLPLGSRDHELISICYETFSLIQMHSNIHISKIL